MASAQRISRGFHRLAILLAAIPLLGGGVVSLKVATEIADRQQVRHDWEAELVCAQDALYKKFYPDLSRDEFERRIRAKLVPIKLALRRHVDESWDDFKARVQEEVRNNHPIEGETDAQLAKLKVPDPDLKELGCSDQPRTVSVQTIFSASRPSSEFSWSGDMLRNLGLFLGILLAISLAVYGLVRGLGWVISGFVSDR